jgi:hypothetical protein
MGQWVEADEACRGPAGEYVLMAYSPDADSNDGVDGLQIELGELGSHAAIEDRLASFESIADSVGAFALIRRCFRRSHTVEPPPSERVSQRYQIELADSAVLVGEDTLPRTIYWSAAVNNMNSDGVSEAQVHRAGYTLRPVLFLPQSGYELRRSGQVIEARTSRREARLYIALAGLTRIIHPSATPDQ